MFLLLLAASERDEAYQFNRDDAGVSFPPPPFVYDAGHDKLPRGVAVVPIPVYSGPYAGKWVLPTSLISNPDFAVMLNFLGGLSTQDVDPADLQNPDDA